MKLIAALVTACLLAACGGGGGGGGGASGPEPIPIIACAPFRDSFGLNVSCAEMNALAGSDLAYLEASGGADGSGDGGADGSAGDGAPIANANLRFTDVNGKVVNTRTDARGQYRISLRGLRAPLVATVLRDGKPWKSMLVADIVRAPANRNFYTINLTGLTDYVVSEVAKRDGLAGPDAITPAAVARQRAQVQPIITALNTELRVPITTAGLDPNNFDPLTKPFQAVLTDSYDKLLESVNVARDPTGFTRITPVFTLGGGVSGLGSATGLTLVNGTETQVIAANATAFTLATKLAQSASYDIRVGTQPVGLTCTVNNGRGVMGSAAVNNVTVACSATTYTLGGTVAGLGNATGLQLSSGGQLLAIAANQAAFVFANRLVQGASYSVAVQTQPAGLTCSVAGGAGTIGTAAVSNVAVTCVVNSFGLGGSVSGLSGGSLVLSSGGQTVSVASGGSSFVFANAIAAGSAYNVTVQTQPANLSCSVSNATGTILTGPVNNVVVNCSPGGFTLGGSVTGLSGGSLVLSGGGQTVSVASGGSSFVFANTVAVGSAYSVTVQTQPANQNCSVSNATGTIATGPVGNVSVNCSLRSYTLGGSVSGLSATGLVLVNGGQALGVAPGASSFVFVANIVSGSTYSVGVQTQPTGLICSVANGNGSIAAANVTGVVVSCLAAESTVSTFVGTGTPGFVDGPILAFNRAAFNNPFGVAVDSSGNLVVGDNGNSAVRKISPAATVATLAGTGSFGFVNGTGAAATFSGATGVALDSAGNVYLADPGNHAIRKISPAGVVSTLAGTGTRGFSSSFGDATGSFNFPFGVAVDSSGNVYVADSDNHAIRKISPTGVVSTLAGNGTAGFVNGSGAAARFNTPYGVAVGANGDVYVADANNHAIRRISPAGVVSTLAGTGAAGLVNGSGATARFAFPRGVAMDGSGNVYVADSASHAIRKISPAGVVSTLAGSGTAGFVNGSGAVASFNNPFGVAVDSSGNVYVTDTTNHTIRKIGP